MMCHEIDDAKYKQGFVEDISRKSDDTNAMMRKIRFHCTMQHDLDELNNLEHRERRKGEQ